MSLMGMRNNRSPAKPTTSASTAGPPSIAIMHELPTASLRPVASSTRPATRVSLPRICIGAAPVRRSPHRRMKSPASRSNSGGCKPLTGASQVGEQPPPARLHGRIDFALLADDAAAPRRHAGIGKQRTADERRFCRQERADELQVARIEPHLHALAHLRKLFE